MKLLNCLTLIGKYWIPKDEKEVPVQKNDRNI